MKRSAENHLSITYHNRFMLGLCVSLLFMIIIFRFLNIETEVGNERIIQDEDALVETIAITRHAPPSVLAPNRPRVGPIEFIDEIVDDELPPFSIDFSYERLEISGSDGDDAIEERPDRAPRVIRIVEATTPEAARELINRVEVIVTLLVNTDGSVDEVFITEIREYDQSGNYQVIDSIGFGIIEETMRAASGWQFVPGRKAGEPVRSYSQHRFIFDR